MIAMNWSGDLDCGGKRSATPLLMPSESGVALRLPPQSKTSSAGFGRGFLHCLEFYACQRARHKRRTAVRPGPQRARL